VLALFPLALSSIYTHVLHSLTPTHCSKSKVVGAFGGHDVHQVEETALIPLPHPDAYAKATEHLNMSKSYQRHVRAQEARYKSLFSR
jgi:hypothetical protein